MPARVHQTRNGIRVGEDGPRIVKAGTNEAALDFKDGRRRVGLGAGFKAVCMLLGRRGTLAPTSLYQLRGDQWKELKEPSPEDDARAVAEKAIAAQVKKRGLPKKTDLRLIWGTVECVNGSILHRDSLCRLEEAVRENLDEAFGAHFLVTLKFDEAGKWKIVKTHRMSEKEVENRDAGEDVSGPAQTTDQEGLSADASFREADRHLNEVYNALRARLFHVRAR